MTLGLPSHLALSGTRMALFEALRWAGLVTLAGAFAAVLVLAASGGVGGTGVLVWPAALAVIVMGLLHARLRWDASPWMLTAVIVVGACATGVYIFTLAQQTLRYNQLPPLVLSLPIIALITIAGAARRPLVGLLWAAVAYGAGYGAAYAAGLLTMRPFELGPITLAAYLVVVLLVLFAGAATARRAVTQPRIHRALRHDQSVAVEHDLAVVAAADLHDSVLSELAALASATPGPLDARLRQRMRDDLDSLGGDPSADALVVVNEQSWANSAVSAAIESARDEGLDVVVSGDRALVDVLEVAVEHALGLAVRQCLVNVIEHAGTLRVDVSLGREADAVTVGVVDQGSGFDASGFDGSSNTGDRMGLRSSVHQRVEAVGGSARVFSQPGEGTSVMLRVPAPSTAEVPAKGGRQ